MWSWRFLALFNKKKKNRWAANTKNIFRWICLTFLGSVRFVCWRLYNPFHFPELQLQPEMETLSGKVLAVAAVVLLLSLAPISESAISCSDVLKDLRPCVNYLRSGNGMPPAACCAGASTLANAATTSADKKAACSCIKSAAKQINPNAQLAQALPGNCGISLPVAVSPNVDCSKFV